MSHSFCDVYQTRPVVVQVKFASVPGEILTLEGPVRYQAGDAIVTGVLGESWPVQRAAFHTKYAPEPGTLPGADGTYRKRRAFVLAQRLQVHTEVDLSANQGTLCGNAGDWVVTYGLGNRAVVRDDIFTASYALAEYIPVLIGIGPEMEHEKLRGVAEAEAALRQSLPHTPLFFLLENDAPLDTPWWLRLKEGKHSASSVGGVSELGLECLVGKDGEGILLQRIFEQLRLQKGWFFSLQRVRDFLASLFSGCSKEPCETEIIAAQLISMEGFNRELGTVPTTDYFIKATPDNSAPMLRKSGVLADTLASECQNCWQQLVLADTRSITDLGGRKGVFWVIGMLRLLCSPSLVTLGLLAAFGLASFSELAGSCDPKDPFAAWTGCSEEVWELWMIPVTFALYLVALLVAWVRYAEAKAGQLENKHQDFRLLAECIRVQYVLEALGRRECVADTLAIARNADSGWVLQALRSLLFIERCRSPVRDVSAGTFDWAMASFVHDQISYHEQTLIKRRKMAVAELSRAGQAGFSLFLVSLVLIVLNVVLKTPGVNVIGMGQHLLLVLQVVGLAFWGGMRKVLDSFGLEQEAQRGEIVLHVLRLARDATLEHPEPLLEAARVFVQDQSAWHALHRSRPIEAATGA